MSAISCNLTVLQQETVAPDIRRLTVQWQDPRHEPHAGQFYMLRAWAADATPILSRPISVNDFDNQTGALTFLYQLKGEGTPDTGLVELALNTAYWTEKDGYYYYTKALKPGEVTAPVFTSVTFNATMGNEYQNATATVDVFAQAVQTANNGDAVMNAQGWPKA